MHFIIDTEEKPGRNYTKKIKRRNLSMVGLKVIFLFFMLASPFFSLTHYLLT